jgi:hypothetical protein
MQDVQPLSNEDKVALRAELVPAMLSLSSPTDKAIRAQVAESVALIAELDFPVKWVDLIDVRRVKRFQTESFAQPTMPSNLLLLFPPPITTSTSVYFKLLIQSFSSGELTYGRTNCSLRSTLCSRNSWIHLCNFFDKRPRCCSQHPALILP